MECVYMSTLPSDCFSEPFSAFEGYKLSIATEPSDAERLNVGCFLQSKRRC
jgi:hypothetical protein